MEHSNTQYQDEISLIEIMKMILKNKKLIVMITFVIAFIATLFAIFVKAPKTVTTARIVLEEESIKNGVNPDESEFNYEQIIAPNILKSVIDNNNLTSKISLTRLRQMIVITPYMPYEISQLFDLKAAGKYEGEINYHPNEFVLSIATNWRSPITESESAALLEDVISTYRAQFVEKYSKDIYLGNLSVTSDVSNYDYIEALTKIKEDLVTLKSVAYKKIQQAPTFKGINGLTFREIADAVSLVLDVDYNSAEALTSVYSLSKDEQKIINKYEYLIQEAELGYQNALAESTSIKAVLATIDKPDSIVIDSTDLSSEELLIAKILNAATGDDYYNQLVVQATEAGESAATFKVNKQFYERELDKFINHSISEEDLVWAKQEVEQDIQLMYDFLVNTNEIFNELNQEYRQTLLNDSIRVALQPNHAKDMKTFLISPIIGVVLGVMLGCVVALFKEYWSAESKGEEVRRLHK